MGCSTQERWVPWVGLETGRDRVTDVQTETCLKLEESEYGRASEVSGRMSPDFWYYFVLNHI